MVGAAKGRRSLQTPQAWKPALGRPPERKAAKLQAPQASQQTPAEHLAAVQEARKL